MAAIWAGGGELVGWLGEKGGVERGGRDAENNGAPSVSLPPTLLLSLSLRGRDGRREKERRWPGHGNWSAAPV